MIYTAVYREKRSEYLRHLKSEYATKKDFENDIRRNGYIPVAILTENDITSIKNCDDKIICKFLKLDFEYVRECL